MVVDNIADLDLAYAPPFSPVLPPVHVAADVARKQLPVRVAPVAAPLKTGRKR
jgi:hypothetical protein